VSRETASRGDEALTLFHLSTCAGRLDRLEEAEALVEECEAITRADGFALLLYCARGQRGVLARWRGDVRRAVELHTEAVASFWGLRYLSGVATALDDLACSLCANGDHHAGLRVAGAGAALHDALGLAITPQGKADLEAYLGLGRRQLGEEVADALFAEGRAMALEDAIAGALTGSW
jgi:hypothetical protein